MKDQTSSADRRIARAAGVVGIGMALSSLTGLVTTMLISRAFGTSADLDAFYAANRLGEIIFSLMAGGALASAFIPTFTGFLTQEDKPQAWRLASSIVNLILIGLTIVSALAWIGAPWLVRNVIAPGFESLEQIQLTVSLLRVMLLSTVIFGVSGSLMGILNAHQHFTMPALAPASYRLGQIIGILFLTPTMGIHGLAWGVVIGAGLHLVIQLPALRGRGAEYKPTLGLKDPSVRQVGKLMAPRLLGVAVVQLNFLINTIIASTQPEGSLTGITLAWTVMMMPELMIAQAIAIAALPTFSAQVARGDPEAMRTSLANTLRGVIFLSLPASLGLILMRTPLVSFLFQRGEFDSASTNLVAWALLWYGVGLVGHALVEVISRAFYALKDTRTPVFVGVAAMTLNIILSLAFSSLFIRFGWMPHGGLALANSLATALESMLLLWLMRKRLSGLDLPRVGHGLRATGIASLVLAATLMLWLPATQGMSLWLIVPGGVVVGLSVFWIAGLVLGAPEARQLPALLLSRKR